MHYSFYRCLTPALLSLFDRFRPERDFRACPGLSLSKTARPIRSAVPVLISSTRSCAGHGRRVPREESSMSIKSKVLSVAATLALVGGVGTAGVLGAGTASAATPSCGIACVNLFSYDFGTHASPNYTVDVLRQGEKVGQPIILFRTANYDPALDWTVSFQGTVADFFAAGLVSSALALHYGCISGPGGDFPNCPFNIAGFNFPVTGGSSDLLAFENQYAPFGVDSGLCLGVAATAFNDEGVTLQPCGVSAKSVWIVDTFDSPTTINNGYVPLING